MKINSDLMAVLMADKSTITPALAWRAGTGGEHAVWRRRFLRKLRQLLGDAPATVPLDVKWGETMEADAFTRRKVYLRSEKNYWVPAYYFVPRHCSGRRPAIVCLHGHSGVTPYIREGDEKQREKTRRLSLDYAPCLAEQGYVTLAVVQRGWNETREGVLTPESGCHRLSMNCFLTGRTPVGLRCHDASRALEFLQREECVDAGKIGAAGLSGGGTTSLFWAAVEPRVNFAMVAGYYCTFADSIYSIHHCICNCVPGIMNWAEMSDVAALIAPRPLLMISGKEDPIFPIAATRRAFSQLKRVYSLLEAEKRLESDFFDGPHAWSNRRTLSFLKKHAPLP